MGFSPEVIQKFEGWKYDADGWNRFSRDYLGVKLDPQQDEALYTIRHNPKTAISSGTSRGKDFLMADAAVCFMFLTPDFDDTGLVGNTKVILTAPTGRQVKDIMRPEIARIFKGAPYLPGYLVGNDIRTPFEEWFLTGFKADDTHTEAWTGFHAVHIFIGVTEATGVAQLIFDAAEGNLQGDSRLVIAFNPNVNHGYAAGAMKDPAFKKIRLNSLDAPNVLAKKIIIPGQVDYQWVIDRIKSWCIKIDPKQMSATEGDFMFEGVALRPNDLFRAKVLGMFPKVSEGVLIPPEWIEIANERWKYNQTHHIQTTQGVSGTVREVMMKTKPLRLGVDVAGMGRDVNAHCYRYGPYVEKFHTFHGVDATIHMEVAGMVQNILKERTDTFSGSFAQAFVDTIGEGAGVFSKLYESSQNQEKWMDKKVHSVKFSEAAKEGDQPLKDVTGQYEFVNLRDYCYWALRDWLNPENKTEAALPPDDELMQELTETRWKFLSNGKIKLEDKAEIRKRIKRSPDKGDSVALTFAPIADIDPRPKAPKKNIGQFFH
jgi:hypothetical protein